MRRILFIMALCLMVFKIHADSYEIKTAFLAPEGSAWMNVMHEFANELTKKTNNEVSLKMYAGGMLGDEKAVIQKMMPLRHQVDAAGFTGMGLGEILPAIRIFELPFMFRSYEEIDFVKDKLFTYFAKEFESKGYVLLGFAEAGFVNIFSQDPIAKYEDMKKAKMWAWEGDPLAKAMFEAYSIAPVSISVTEVLMSLESKIINSFYAPPLAAIALQWFNKVKYMTDLPVNFSVGGLLITKKKFDSLPEAHQKTLRELSLKFAKKLVLQIREDNKKSYEVLKKAKLEFVKVKDEDLKPIVEISEKVREKLINQLYSKDLLNKMTALIKEFREQQTKLAKQ